MKPSLYCMIIALVALILFVCLMVLGSRDNDMTKFYAALVMLIITGIFVVLSQKWEKINN